MGIISIAADAAHPCAVSIVECLRPAFREEELNDVFREVFDRVKAAVEAALIIRTRELQRLDPINSN